MPILAPIFGLLARAVPWIAGLFGAQQAGLFKDEPAGATGGILGFSTKDIVIIGIVVAVIIWLTKKD